MTPSSPCPQFVGQGLFCAVRQRVWRPEFVKITSPRKFPIEFFVQFVILIFPAIGGILILRGEANDRRRNAQG